MNDKGSDISLKDMSEPVTEDPGKIREENGILIPP